ncbi:MAG: CAP domain-containing protein [Spirochaetaceae bacterium]|jgi:uncharacterized protein YkwD|nr:CAP domain-containing protein [Spirochaetaceae bacterium]
MQKRIVVLGFVFLGLGLAFSSCESLKTSLDSVGKSLSEAASNISGGNGSGGGLAGAKYDPDKRGDPDSAHWDIETLDTAANADYLTGVEKDVILEMNKVRNNPKKYAERYIQPTLKYYNGKNYEEPGHITIVTQEGAAAVNACISALSKSKSAGVLSAEKGIWLAAKDHAIDQSKTGRTGHDGSDGSDPFTRMKRYGGYNTAGENCAYGPNTGRDIVVQFLVDDGVPSRGHRKNIMNAAFSQTGVSVQTHPEFRYCCVIDYANGYVSK